MEMPSVFEVEKRGMEEIQFLLVLFSEKTRRPHSSWTSAWRKVEKIWSSHTRALNPGSLSIIGLERVPLRHPNDHLQETQSASCQALPRKK